MDADFYRTEVSQKSCLYFATYLKIGALYLVGGKPFGQLNWVKGKG
jgi:hypothetical protein